MRRARRQYAMFQPFSDMLMNLVGMIMLIVAVLVIVTVNSKGQLDYHPKAEYLVTLDWPDDRNVDLDLWLRNPFGDTIFYLNREASNVSLDRDSRGFTTNQQTLEGGAVITSDNREIIAVRAIIPGDYLVAVSYYAGTDAKTGVGYSFLPPDPLAPIDLRVRVEKVNPRMTTVFDQKFHFNQVKEAMNIVAFHVDPGGKVTILPLPAENLVQQHGGSPLGPIIETQGVPTK